MSLALKYNENTRLKQHASGRKAGAHTAMAPFSPAVFSPVKEQQHERQSAAFQHQVASNSKQQSTRQQPAANSGAALTAVRAGSRAHIPERAAQAPAVGYKQQCCDWGKREAGAHASSSEASRPPAASRSHSFAYSCCRRDTTGPRAARPMGRPSTDATGSTPAIVPKSICECFAVVIEQVVLPGVCAAPLQVTPQPSKCSVNIGVSIWILTCDKGLVGAIDLCECEVQLAHREALLCRQAQHQRARDAWGGVGGVPCALCWARCAG